MKFKTTRKYIKETYKNTICVSYCDLQNLLSCLPATYYITRIEGWAADIYTSGDAAIITGYDPFGKFKPDRKILEKYNTRAEKIKKLYPFKIKKWETIQNRLYKLLDQFIEEVTKNENGNKKYL